MIRYFVVVVVVVVVGGGGGGGKEGGGVGESGLSKFKCAFNLINLNISDKPVKTV